MEKLLKDFKNEIKNIENSLDELFENNPELKQHRENLQTIPGIGKTTATSILAESPDLSSFKSPRQYAAYAGLVPKHRTSGSSIRGKARLSKLGSSKLRKALYLPAVVAKNHNPILKAFSNKLKSKVNIIWLLSPLLCVNFFIFVLLLLNLTLLLFLMP